MCQGDAYTRTDIPKCTMKARTCTDWTTLLAEDPHASTGELSLPHKLIPESFSDMQEEFSEMREDFPEMQERHQR